MFAAAVKTGAPNLGLLWLVILADRDERGVALLLSARCLKQIYVVENKDGTNGAKVPVLNQVVLGLIALLVVGLGCFPNLLVGALQRCQAAMGP